MFNLMKNARKASAHKTCAHIDTGKMVDAHNLVTERKRRKVEETVGFPLNLGFPSSY